MSVLRCAHKLHVNAMLPKRIITSDSRCYWKLRNSTSGTDKVVKKCFKELSDDCGNMPPLCKLFSIVGVEDTHGYHLTVFYSNNLAICGSATIEKGT